MQLNDIKKYFMNLAKLIVENKTYLLHKYLPTSLMFLLSAYIYSLLRGVKDSILVPVLGAELISFIKFYGVFPATVVFPPTVVGFTVIVNMFEYAGNEELHPKAKP